MKTDMATIKKIETLFQDYKSEIQELEKKNILKKSTAKTYLNHSGNFVKWCQDEFEPGIMKK